MSAGTLTAQVVTSIEIAGRVSDVNVTATGADIWVSTDGETPFVGNPNTAHRVPDGTTRTILVADPATPTIVKLVSDEAASYTVVPGPQTVAAGSGATDAEVAAAAAAAAAAAVDALVTGAPGALDTLNELAAALGDDANFAATLTAALALKAPIASPTFTGITTAPEFSASGLTGAVAASRYVGGTASGAPTTGTFAVGDFVIDRTGKIWICTVAGTPGTWVGVHQGGAYGLIAIVAPNPGSTSTASTTSTSFADADATNLAVAFTAPPSGNVLVSVSIVGETGAGTTLAFNLREAAANLANTASDTLYDSAAVTSVLKVSNRWYITGLTPGSAHTYKLGIARAFGSGGCNVQWGGARGAAVLAVEACP